MRRVRDGKQGEARTMHLNIVRGCEVDSLDVSEAEYAERYAALKVISEETDGGGKVSLTVRGD